MKLLILGGNEMMGHMISEKSKQQPKYNMFYTIRDLKDKNSLCQDIIDFEKIEEIIELIMHGTTINNDWMRNQ